jgi:hypothetical protein
MRLFLRMRMLLKDLYPRSAGQGQLLMRAPLAAGWLWLAFFTYVILLGIGCIRHEMWTDELHSWNLSKGSGSYAELLFNKRYEGHPPGWYTLLWVLSKFTHRVAFIQLLQWFIALTTVFILLFFSPIPSRSKVLIPFGYYFLWEYGVFSRNYNIAILLAFCVCVIIRKEFRFKDVLYYALLFLLSNIHLLGALLAISLQGYYLMQEKERGRPLRVLVLHAGLAVLVLLPSVWLSLPPSERHSYGLLRQTAGYRFRAFYEMPIRAFLPIPAWWKDHFWNSHFLLTLKDQYFFTTFFLSLVALLLILPVYRCLRDEPKSLALFTTNLGLSLLVGTFLTSLLTARHSGFVFVGFLIAYWLYCKDKPVSDHWISPINLLLALQLAGGLFAFSQDVRRPFSNGFMVPGLLREVPAGQKWVTDYWTFTAVVAYTDHPAYCVDMKKALPFIVWGVDIPTIEKDTNRYTNGLNLLFARKDLRQIYLITHAPLEMLERADSQLHTAYRFSLVDSRTGAIDDGSDLYLFRIEPVH